LFGTTLIRGHEIFFSNKRKKKEKYIYIYVLNQYICIYMYTCTRYNRREQQNNSTREQSARPTVHTCSRAASNSTQRTATKEKRAQTSVVVATVSGQQSKTKTLLLFTFHATHSERKIRERKHLLLSRRSVAGKAKHKHLLLFTFRLLCIAMTRHLSHRERRRTRSKGKKENNGYIALICITQGLDVDKTERNCSQRECTTKTK